MIWRLVATRNIWTGCVTDIEVVLGIIVSVVLVLVWSSLTDCAWTLCSLLGLSGWVLMTRPLRFSLSISCSVLCWSFLLIVSTVMTVLMLKTTLSRASSACSPWWCSLLSVLISSVWPMSFFLCLAVLVVCVV